MLEWLAVSTGMGLGKLVLEQVLDLSKPVLEGYAQDFFGDCLDSGVARLKFGTLKEPMAEAIGCFIKRFIEELQLNFVPETSIEHHYRGAIKRFVRDKAVGQILGKAFETDCKQIDYAELERIWAEQYQESGWQFPAAEFDWRGVAKKYVFEVKGIVRANAELRALLETDLLETIAQNTAQVSPGFDIEAYRESLQYSYGYLKLYTLDSTDRVDAIKLWNIFVEQTVREALPPTRYELPLDLKRKLQEEGQLEEDLSPEALEHYRREYFEQPARKVLEVVVESPRAVILGDPGSGKSSLLQYLALEWVEGKTETLPLLIELREFAVSQCSNFLEFLHRGRGADWQFDQQQLHQHLLENPTLVMFDGLDEIFDRATQAAVVDDIVRFAQQYPQAKVLVTSRIIGYNPERLRHSGFRHFTMQSLDTDEIHEFIDRWYDLSMGSAPDKERLKQRLKDAIGNSKAIQNLADNPLLLTMMAILNRRQELPRDRADLYDQASRVLLYHWDVDHKRLKLPLDTIGRLEKQEILRLIAYEMQAGDSGLKGNLISAENFIRILTEYLRDQGFSEPRDKANLLIQQLRERNYILCYRGADNYGFVHRTFLEYFCAVEIVKRFEKLQTLTFNQLREDIFGNNWQNEAWHEVLQLICGMLGRNISEKLILFILENNCEKESFSNIFLANECLLEIKKVNVENDTRNRVLIALQSIIGQHSFNKNTTSSNEQAKWHGLYTKAFRMIAEGWKEKENVFAWFKEKADSEDFLVKFVSIKEASRAYRDHPQILEWLKEVLEKDSSPTTQKAFTLAIENLKISKANEEVYSILENLLKSNTDWVRQSALITISEIWNDDSRILRKLKKALDDESAYVRWVAVQFLARHWRSDLEVLPAIKSHFSFSEDFMVRREAIKALVEYWLDQEDVMQLLINCCTNDPFERSEDLQGDEYLDENPRKLALEGLVRKNPDSKQVFDLLRERSTNDSDPQLRKWAQQRIEKLELHQSTKTAQ